MPMRRLVILGGGYGGLKVLQTLLNQYLPHDLEITLIDKNPYHSLKTEFYTIAAGTSADKEVRIPFPRGHRVRYIVGEAVETDLVDQQSISKRL